MFTLVLMSYMVACGLVHVKQEVLIGMVHLVIVVLFSHSVLLAWSICVAFTHGQLLPFRRTERAIGQRRQHGLR